MSEALAIPAPPKRPGFFVGLGELFSGIAFVVKTPKLWPLASVPIGVAAFLIAVTSGLGIWASVSLADSLLAGKSGSLATLAAVSLKLVLGLLSLVTAVLIGTSLAQPLSGWALEKMVRRVQLELREPISPDEPLVQSTLRGLGVTVVGLLMSLPILVLLAVIGLAFPPATVVTIPLKFVVGSLVLAWDLFDYPLGLYRVGLGDRFRYFRKNFGPIFGLGVGAMSILLVPCVGLILLPMGVVGATRVVVELRRAEGTSPLRAL